jgi:hypothetical protein
MNAVRRFLGLFQNSPTFGRDRANLISGITIGTTSLALNGVILVMVLPLMLNPNDTGFRRLTENMEFGQLLGLILLGGATAFATLLIPMRLATVFMAPRIGRYFDQIVLSGITPLRFLIGKATSQNLFLGLSLFLLLPWFVLVLSLGGLDWSVFLANMFLVWLYCMMLALVMLWLSLYLNEVLAMLVLVYGAAVLCGLGCVPFPYQPFIVTPFPALMHSVYAAVNVPDIEPTRSFFSVFASCAVGMSIVSGMSLAAIYLGPLYGIIRDNSTFGEVVRTGDSKRKRRFRFRLHIQRPSEIAFFYENRGDTFRKNEGLVRWGTVFLCLLTLSGVVWSLTILLTARQFSMMTAANYGYQFLVYELYVICHTIHGIGLVLAVFLFSHARNTTYLRLPLMFGWKAEVSRLDTIGFVLFLLISTATSIGVPVWIDHVVASPAGATMFPAQKYVTDGGPIDFARISIEGTLAISVAGLTVYLLQRTLCLAMWLKTAAMVSVTFFYLGAVCIIPFIVGVMAREIPELRNNPVIQENAMQMAMMSPFMVFMFLYREMGPVPAHNLSTVPFYLLHCLIIVFCLLAMWSRGRRLRMEYAAPLPKETC